MPWSAWQLRGKIWRGRGEKRSRNSMRGVGVLKKPLGGIKKRFNAKEPRKKNFSVGKKKKRKLKRR